MFTSKFTAIILTLTGIVLLAGPAKALGMEERLLYTSARGGSLDIWMCDIDGANHVQLTDKPGREISPKVSPDGTEILYASYPVDGSAWEIWIMAVDGSYDRKVEVYKNAFPRCWSPDGNSLLYSYFPGGSWQGSIWQVNKDGTDDHLLFAPFTPYTQVQAQDWRNGMILFVASYNHSGNNKLFILYKDDMTYEPLSDGRSELGEFNGDGTMISCLVDNYLTVVDLEDWSMVQSLYYPLRVTYYPFSPAGDQLAFAMDTGTGTRDIFIMNLDGSGLTQITFESDIDAMGDWAMINLKPVASAGPDQIVSHDVTVPLNGEDSYDPDEDYPLAFTWQFVSTPAGSQAVLEGADTAYPSFVADALGDYIVELVVMDVLGNTSEPDQVIITATNGSPAASAGENMALASEEVAVTVILGSASDDDPADVLEYRWLMGETVLLDWTPVDVTGECPLELFGLPLALGTHTLTLEVTDGFDVAADDMLLTIENSAPHAAPVGSGVYEIATPVLLGGSVSDYDGDLLEYRWLDDGQVLTMGLVQAIAEGYPVPLDEFITYDLSLGIHTITLEVDDSLNAPAVSAMTVEIVDTTVPTLAPVADRTILWPPNHKMVDIYVEAHATDNSGLPVSLTGTISSNEPVDGTGDGDTAPDWTEPVIDQATGTMTFQLRAERSGSGNGRIYTITITATDNAGNQSSADLQIIVPHDKRKK